MFKRTKPQASQGPVTSIRTARDFNQVTIITVDVKGNESQIGVKQNGYGIQMEDGEYTVMVGLKDAEDLHISRDYFKAQSPQGQRVLRDIDETLKLNGRNVTRWLLTRPHLPADYR